MEKFNEPIYVTRPVLPDLEKITKKLGEVWDSKILSNMGKQHKTLELELTRLLKVPHLSLFNNGTNALITAIQSLKISGECITTPFTFPATPHSLARNNITPIFCDISPESLCIDHTKIEKCITPRTTGILGVHVFGTPCDVEKIQDIADFYGLKVIYDGAHVFQTEIAGTGIGNFGDITMFSFHPTKLFHTGEGGALTYSDKNLKQRIDLLKNFGIKNEEEVVLPGINGKMSEIQAVIGLVMLEHIEEEREKRKKILEIYKKNLDVPGIKFNNLLEDVKNSYQYFVIRIDEKIFGKSRDFLYSELKRYNVFTRKYFYPLCSDYSCYSHLKSRDLPVAEKTVTEVLCLPFYGDLGEDNAKSICELILDLGKK